MFEFFPKNIIFLEIRKDSSNKSTVFFDLEKQKCRVKCRVPNSF